MAQSTPNSASKAPNGTKPDPQSVPVPQIDVILSCLDDSKAEETISIDMEGKSPLADFMVVTSGRSHRHVAAIADHLSKALKDAGHGPSRIEGLNAADWVLLDAGDVIVHIFRPEVREFYNLEKMWTADADADTTSH